MVVALEIFQFVLFLRLYMEQLHKEILKILLIEHIM